jgi:hypothetical protein
MEQHVTLQKEEGQQPHDDDQGEVMEHEAECGQVVAQLVQLAEFAVPHGGSPQQGLMKAWHKRVVCQLKIQR